MANWNCKQRVLNKTNDGDIIKSKSNGIFILEYKMVIGIVFRVFRVYYEWNS